MKDTLNRFLRKSSRWRLFSVFLILFAGACSDPYKLPEEYMQVFIPLVTDKAEVLQEVPLVKNSVNFVPVQALGFEKDSLFRLGIYCSGTNNPSEDIHVKLALATDSLQALQRKGIPQSGYLMLPESLYSVKSWEVVIPKGQECAYFDVELKNTRIPEGSTYILPIKIEYVSKYAYKESNSFILLGFERK